MAVRVSLYVGVKRFVGSVARNGPYARYRLLIVVHVGGERSTGRVAG